MGILDWFSKKPSRSRKAPVDLRFLAETPPERIYGNWRLLDGSDANREAIKQNIMSEKDNFDAVMVTQISPSTFMWVTLTGTVQCHACPCTTTFVEKQFLQGFAGMTRSCQCGAKFTLLMCKGVSPDTYFVVAVPFKSHRTPPVRTIGMTLTSISSFGHDQQTGCREGVAFAGHNMGVRCVAVSPGGKRLLTGDGQGQLRVWDVNGPLLTQWAAHDKGINAIDISPDGTKAITGGDDCAVRLWDVETHKQVASFVVDGMASVGAVAFSPKGLCCASGSSEVEINRRVFKATLIVWDIASGKEVRRFSGHSSSVNGLAFTSDGARLFSSSGDKTVRTWEVASGKQVSCRKADDEVVSVSCSSDGERVVYGTYTTRTVSIVNVSSGAEVTFRGHSESVTCVAIAGDGRFVLSGSSDRTARLIDALSGREIRRFIGADDRVGCVAFCPSLTRVFVGGADNVLRAYDLAQNV